MTTRARTRIASLVGACALVALTLTGCLKVDADLAINSDAQGTGTVGFELQKDAAGFMGISDVTSFENSVTTGDLSDTGLGELAACDTSESDTAYIYTCTFADQAFTDPAGMWTIEKAGDVITFHMVNAGQTGTDTASGMDPSALLGDASLGSINVKVTFPGNITTVTGTGVTKTSDTSATIAGTMTAPLDVTITSEAGSGGPKIAALLVVLGAVAVIALIVIVIVVLLVRRRKPAAGEVAVAATGAVVATEVVATEVVTTDAVVLDDAGTPTEVVETVTDTVTETFTEPMPDAPTDTND